MADARDEKRGDGSNYESPAISELFRITWMVLGPAGLMFAGAMIWKQPSWTYTVMDMVFWGLAALAVIAKAVDIKVFRGRTTEDKPATMAHWRAYSAKLLLFATALWLLAQWAHA
jgi:hypothetical protein